MQDTSDEATSLDLKTVPELSRRAAEAEEGHGHHSAAQADDDQQLRCCPQAPGGAAVLQNTIQQLVPLYNAYRTSWKMLHQGLAQGVDSLPAQDRGQLIVQLQRRMPEMAQEPMFQEIAKNLGRR